MKMNSQLVLKTYFLKIIVLLPISQSFDDLAWI